jgi:hypothetical protein
MILNTVAVQLQNDKVEVIENGNCECVFEPRGDDGLEGYQRNIIYKFWKNITQSHKKFFLVFKCDRVWGWSVETIQPEVFNKYFKTL